MMEKKMWKTDYLSEFSTSKDHNSSQYHQTNTCKISKSFKVNRPCPEGAEDQLSP